MRRLFVMAYDHAQAWRWAAQQGLKPFEWMYLKSTAALRGCRDITVVRLGDRYVEAEKAAVLVELRRMEQRGCSVTWIREDPTAEELAPFKREAPRLFLMGSDPETVRSWAVEHGLDRGDWTWLRTERQIVGLMNLAVVRLDGWDSRPYREVAPLVSRLAALPSIGGSVEYLPAYPSEGQLVKFRSEIAGRPKMLEG